jgi:hypothetical protein
LTPYFYGFLSVKLPVLAGGKPSSSKNWIERVSSQNEKARRFSYFHVEKPINP